MKKIKILIVDDHLIARNGLRLMLEDQEEILFELEEAESGAQAIDVLSKEVFDIILLDLEMPKVDGFTTLSNVRENGVNTPIIIFSFYDDELIMHRAKNCGANGFLPKGVSTEELIKGIKSTLEKDTFYNGLKGKTQEIDKSESSRLTKREREVLKLIAEECSNIEIASILGISVRTVEGHKKNVIDTLLVKGSVGLTKYAIKHGIIRNS